MKKVLIISPHYPPVNAVDMHRVRMSLPYFRQLGWEPVVLSVHENETDFPRDELLIESIPADIRVIKVKALKRVPGINGLALRAVWPVYQAGKRLLKKEKFDLVYFSTTMFPMPLLGSLWKRSSRVPYVIDMQDPWYSTYYDDKPLSERPPKHWLSNRLHKYTEPVAMKNVDGLISVSQKYIDTLIGRYPRLKYVPARIIPFSASFRDLEIAIKYPQKDNLRFNPKDGFNHIIYIGRVGSIMQKSLRQLFAALKKGLSKNPAFYQSFRFHFIGTDYAASNRAKLSVLPVAAEFNLLEYVFEDTARIPFYSTISHLKQASGIIIPGSDDAAYTASKIFPYLMVEKPLLGIFHPESPVVDVLRRFRTGSLSVLGEPAERTEQLLHIFLQKASLQDTIEKNLKPVWNAEHMSRQQVELFNQIV